MKKLLLISSIALTGVFSNAQILLQEDMSKLTIGNISETMNTPGQNNWVPQNGAVSDYQVADFNGEKTILIKGSNTATTNKFLFKSGMNTVWNEREEFNDIVQLEFDFFTGPATTSENTARYAIVNTAGNTLAGFLFNQKTKAPGVILYMLPCNLAPQYCTDAYPAGNYSLSYSTEAGDDFFLEPNTWVKVGLAWDKNTGEVFFKIVQNGDLVINDDIVGAAPATDINQVNMIVAAGAGNTVSSDNHFKGILLEAVSELDLLAVGDVVNVKSNVSIYPNPTADFINFASKAKVQSVQIFDMSGKAINAQLTDNKVDVRDLGKGTYIVKVQTAEGTTTSKFIKK